MNFQQAHAKYSKLNAKSIKAYKGFRTAYEKVSRNPNWLNQIVLNLKRKSHNKALSKEVQAFKAWMATTTIK